MGSAAGAGWALYGLYTFTHGIFSPHRRLAAPAAATISLAEHSRSVPHLAVGDHAAADPGRHRDPVLRALPGPLSRRGRAGRRRSGRRDALLGRPGLLRAPATCTAAHKKSRATGRAASRPRPKPSPPCRGSAAPRRPPSPPLPTASVRRSWTATSSACSRATSASPAIRQARGRTAPVGAGRHAGRSGAGPGHGRLYPGPDGPGRHALYARQAGL